MLTKPKYKICKRLGSGIYEKCQTQKFALSEARAKKTFKRRRTMSDYGRQLLEKQKVRMAYGINERQLQRYASEATKAERPVAELFKILETRLDNVVYRLGFAPTRRAARQMVSHGHITVNGKKMTVPSHHVEKGDAVSVREQSKSKTVFTARADDMQEHTPAKWLSADTKALTASVKEGPEEFTVSESLFDLPAVLEYYSR
ncbi:MAG: 30S ribosomal protein S4 [bacterium]|nr:30S ribosomal protein S4 [bacterium]